MFMCSSCSSFVPPVARACPGCGQSAPLAARVVGSAVALAGGSLFAMTLSACYGVADPDRRFGDAGFTGFTDSNAMGLTEACDDVASDLDGDGYCGELDCDESNPDVHHAAADAPGDGLDADCDGVD